MTKQPETLSKSYYLFLKSRNPANLKPEHKEYIRRYEETNAPKIDWNYWNKVFEKSGAEKKRPEKKITKKIFMAVGKQVANNSLGYVIDEQNKHAVLFVYQWLAKNDLPPVTLNKPGHHKGILLAGNVGSGKTTLIDIIRRFRPARKSRAAQVVEMIEEAKATPELLKKFDLFLDELGTEKKSYGAELMPAFLEMRYEQFKSKGLLTHITTNMSMEEIAERYGPRIESRLWEMCNIIYLGAEEGSRDFRKLL